MIPEILAQWGHRVRKAWQALTEPWDQKAQPEQPGLSEWWGQAGHKVVKVQLEIQDLRDQLAELDLQAHRDRLAIQARLDKLERKARKAQRDKRARKDK